MKSIFLKVQAESSVLTILQCVCMKRFVTDLFGVVTKVLHPPIKTVKNRGRQRTPGLLQTFISLGWHPKQVLFFSSRYYLLCFSSLKQIVYMCVAHRPKKASFHSWVWRSCCSWFWWLWRHHCVSITSYEKEGSLNLIDLLIWVCFALSHIPYHRSWFMFFTKS